MHFNKGRAMVSQSLLYLSDLTLAIILESESEVSRSRRNTIGHMESVVQ